jgi:hypothetical protein
MSGNQTQAAFCVAMQHRFHERALAGAARTREEHIVRRLSGHELLRVAIDHLVLLLNTDQPIGVHFVNVRNGFKIFGRAGHPPSRRDLLLEVRSFARGRCHAFKCVGHACERFEELFAGLAH